MGRPEIVVARSAGFCWGVERALEKAIGAEGEDAPVDTLGPLIHNPGVTADLARRGIGLLDDPEGKTEGTVIVRSHGVPRDTMALLESRGLKIVDATCSFVKAAQTKAARLHEEGYLVVVLGEPRHPEVLGIRSYAGPDALVVEGPDDLPAALAGRRVGVVVQTTQSQGRLAALVAALSPLVRELRVFNTICSATDERQRAAVEMASAADVVVVVGGRSSGNTQRLAQLCEQIQPRTYHVEGANEIEPVWLEGARVIGVTAGASTPNDQIESVVDKLRELVS